MQCKFLDHGIQIHYSGVVRPCCVLQPTDQYRSQNHITQVDLSTWHTSSSVQSIKQQLAAGTWPSECSWCQQLESQSRQDSMRLNGDAAYSHYAQDELVLEIRPGNTCNLACQTCWPQASSRVTDYYRKAKKTIDIKGVDSVWDATTILPVLPRVKDIIILGGEPFYDKKTLGFLSWLSQQSHQPNLTIFTNGSVVDVEWLANYAGKITLVFSLDAVGVAAEYVRFGCKWADVWANYQRCLEIDTIEVRVNITTSPYNYAYILPLVEQLLPQWPKVVSWGIASQSSNSLFMCESAVPTEKRTTVIAYLEPVVELLSQANIDHMQKINAINAITSIVSNLNAWPYDADKHKQMLDFIQDMDQVKHVDIQDYCPEVVDYLGVN